MKQLCYKAPPPHTHTLLSIRMFYHINKKDNRTLEQLSGFCSSIVGAKGGSECSAPREVCECIAATSLLHNRECMAESCLDNLLLSQGFSLFSALEVSLV